MPKPILENENEVKNTNRHNAKGKKDMKHSKQWILSKKERHRKQGKEVRPDTKYTGRKRPTSF